MSKGRFNMAFFLLGLGSQLQVYLGGAIGLSEIFIFAVAPFVFCVDLPTLRKDGFLPVVYLSLLSLLGCAISCIYNQVAFPFAIRGYMANYSMFATIVVIHHFLRKDLNGFKWCLLGLAFSWLISTFVFQQATELYLYSRGGGGDAAEDIMSGPLFWAGRIGGFWVLPYQGWYMTNSSALNVILPTVWAIVAIMISQGSGRSLSLSLLGGAFIIFMCGKKIDKIRRVMQHMGTVLICAIFGVFIFTAVYRWAASSGALGEAALKKYEMQVKGAKSPLAVLMSGRADFFIGLSACLKRPFVGYGPWPLDTEHIYENWISKYGDAEAVEKYFERKLRNSRGGNSEKFTGIPSHSVIIQFWLWYGIFGLFLWLYVLRSMWRYIRFDMAAIPQYIGFVAAGIPTYLWNILFSPFAGRVSVCLFISMILMAGAVRKGVVSLPSVMIDEILKHNPGRVWYK